VQLITFGDLATCLPLLLPY